MNDMIWIACPCFTCHVSILKHQSFGSDLRVTVTIHVYSILSCWAFLNDYCVMTDKVRYPSFKSSKKRALKRGDIVSRWTHEQISSFLFWMSCRESFEFNFLKIRRTINPFWCCTHSHSDWLWSPKTGWKWKNGKKECDGMTLKKETKTESHWTEWKKNRMKLH